MKKKDMMVFGVKLKLCQETQRRNNTIQTCNILKNWHETYTILKQGSITVTEINDLIFFSKEAGDPKLLQISKMYRNYET